MVKITKDDVRVVPTGINITVNLSYAAWDKVTQIALRSLPEGTNLDWINRVLLDAINKG